MDDAPATRAPDSAPLDPANADPRALMQALLPAARAEYIKAWEFLADPGTSLERRRTARTRAKAIAADHVVIAEVLRKREPSLAGDPLLNARHLAGEFERHAEALEKLATISVMGLAEATALRPEALGCGKQYRVPAQAASEAGTASRNVRSKPVAKARDSRDRGRGNDRPFSDKGPKVPRDALGTSKHDSPLADDLDPETRAKLEALRAGLDSGE